MVTQIRGDRFENNGRAASRIQDESSGHGASTTALGNSGGGIQTRGEHESDAQRATAQLPTRIPAQHLNRRSSIGHIASYTTPSRERTWVYVINSKPRVASCRIARTILSCDYER